MHVFTWKCASHHNAVQNCLSLISPDGATKHWRKNMENTQCFAIFHDFSTLLSSSFFCLFSSLTLPTSAFPSVHWPYCRSLTSKLPSVIGTSRHGALGSVFTHGYLDRAFAFGKNENTTTRIRRQPVCNFLWPVNFAKSVATG